jgi:hypothetical protein
LFSLLPKERIFINKFKAGEASSVSNSEKYIMIIALLIFHLTLFPNNRI